MERFIDEEIGLFNERHSKYIAEIGRETKSENFEHLIIVTNGCVDYTDIDESEFLIKKYGLVYKYVTNYVVGNGNRSVGSSYMKSCPSVAFYIDKYGNESQQTSLSLKDLRALNEIDSINNWNTFNSKYSNLLNAINEKCLGRKEDLELMSKLKNLKSRIRDAGSSQNEFNNKFNVLYRIVSGNII